MNIESKSTEQEKTKCQIFSDKISNEIWKTIGNPDENLTQSLNKTFNKVFKLISKNDLNNPNIQREIFEQILSFLNNLFWKVEIKKFYNNIPKTDIKKYSEKNLWEQFIHNIYWKQRKLFYRDEIWGWSCSYWTILFKHFFEELEKRGMNLKSEIFFYPNDDMDGWRWHSWVLVSFQWKTYLADFWGFNQNNDNQIIESVDNLNKIYCTNNFDCFKDDAIKRYYKTPKKKKEKFKWPLFFHDVWTFTERRSQRARNNATIEFVPKLDWKQSKDVKFEFQPDKVYLTIDGIQHTFTYVKDGKTPRDIPDEKFFDYFISHIQHLQTTDKSTKEIIKIKWEKTIFTEYLNIIREKISIEKLRKIYGN